MSSLSKFENDAAALVLAAAEGVLEEATAFAASRGIPLKDYAQVEKDRLESIVDGDVIEDDGDVSWLASRLVEKFRINALGVEAELKAKWNVALFHSDPGSGVYRFTRMLHLSKQGEVTCLVGAVIGDASDPFFVDPEAPLVFEVFAGDLQCSLADRVRVLSQLVCFYGDAIRFGGFGECPLGDAIGLLRDAVGALRESYAEEAGGYADDSESD